jgi:hypothetical protein
MDLFLISNPAAPRHRARQLFAEELSRHMAVRDG